MTLLMVACHEGQRDVINALLDLGAPLDALGEKGNTALAAALEGLVLNAVLRSKHIKGSKEHY